MIDVVTQNKAENGLCKKETAVWKKEMREKHKK